MVFWGGVPEEWDFHEHHSGFIEVLEAAWVKCKTKLTEQHLGHEDRITDELVQEAKKHPIVAAAPYQIIPQYTVYLEGGKKGFIDLVLTIGDDDLYLAYEAKCLNTPDSKAAAYVKDGMIDRYITGKYSHKMKIAGMVGYVHDGNMGRAEKNISNAIFREAIDLLMNLAVKPGWINHKTTTHHKRAPLPITLSHLLLSVV